MTRIPRIGTPRVRLPTAYELAQAEQRGIMAAAAGRNPETIAADLRNLPPFITFDSRVVRTDDFAVRQAAGVDKSLVVVRGADSRLDIDGRPLTIAPAGRVQFHGLETERPDFLIRTSRDPSGRSNNHCEFSRVDATGVSKAHVSLESCELSHWSNCQLEQYKGDGAAVSINNAHREADPSARHVATCSGHAFYNCGFGNYGADGTVADQWRGCCVRIWGMAERATFYNGWFAGLGKATAMTIVAMDLEQWPGGGRLNWPRRIALDDCSAEGAPFIRLYGYGDVRCEWQHGSRVYSAKLPWTEPDGSEIWWPVVTLRGISAEPGEFIVTRGEMDIDLFDETD